MIWLNRKNLEPGRSWGSGLWEIMAYVLAGKEENIRLLGLMFFNLMPETSVIWYTLFNIKF